MDRPFISKRIILLVAYCVDCANIKSIKDMKFLTSLHLHGQLFYNIVKFF